MGSGDGGESGAPSPTPRSFSLCSIRATSVRDANTAPGQHRAAGAAAGFTGVSRSPAASSLQQQIAMRWVSRSHVRKQL